MFTAIVVCSHIYAEYITTCAQQQRACRLWTCDFALEMCSECVRLGRGPLGRRHTRAIPKTNRYRNHRTGAPNPTATTAFIHVHVRGRRAYQINFSTKTPAIHLVRRSCGTGFWCPGWLIFTRGQCCSSWEFRCACMQFACRRRRLGCEVPTMVRLAALRIPSTNMLC